MLISVIMPCFRSGKFVGQALDSIRAQTYPHWELVAVDDGGPEDGTIGILDRFAGGFPAGQVRVLRHAANKGCCAARNTAMRAASGQLFAFLDPDDAWESGHLAEAAAQIGQHDLCVARAQSVDEGGRPIGLFLGDRIPGLVAGFPASLMRENFILPSAVVIRRAIFDRVGGFDESPAIQYAPDWDYWLRSVAAGTDVLFLDSVGLRYRKHPEAVTSNYLNITKGCVVALRKNLPGMDRGLARDLRETLYIHLARLVYLKISFRDWSALADLAGAIRLEPRRMDVWRSFGKGLKNNW